MNSNCQIQYKNVLLKGLEKKDIEKLRNWRNDQELSKYLRKIPYITKEEQEEWFNYYCIDKSIITFAIFQKDNKNDIVGSVSIYACKNDECEMGKFLIGDINVRNKEVGFNSWKSVCYFAFVELQIHNIICKVNRDNKPAINIYKKTGFKIQSLNNNEYTMLLDKKSFYNNHNDLNDIEISKSL